MVELISGGGAERGIAPRTARVDGLFRKIGAFDPLAVWLDLSADLCARGQSSAERWRYQLEARARVVYEELRLGRWIDWS